MWYEKVQDVDIIRATLLDEKASIQNERDLAHIEPTVIADLTGLGEKLCAQLVRRARKKFDVQPLLTKYEIKERTKRYVKRRGIYIPFLKLMKALQFTSQETIKKGRQTLRQWLIDEKCPLITIPLGRGIGYGLREWKYSKDGIHLRRLIKQQTGIFTRDLKQIHRDSGYHVPYGLTVQQLLQEGLMRLVRHDMYYVQDPDAMQAQTPEEVIAILLEIFPRDVWYSTTKIADILQNTRRVQKLGLPLLRDLIEYSGWFEKASRRDRYRLFPTEGEVDNLLNKLASFRVFTTSDVQVLCKGSTKHWDNTRRMIKRGIRKGVIHKVTNGIFIFQREDKTDQGAYVDQLGALAAYGNRNTHPFLLYTTALTLHSGMMLSEGVPFYISQPNKMMNAIQMIPPCKVQSVRNNPAYHSLCTMRVLSFESPVTTPESTWLNAIRKPEKNGGWQEIVAHLRRMKDCNVDLLIKWSAGEPYGRLNSWYKRWNSILGYLLELIRENTENELEVRERHLKELQQRLPSIFAIVRDEKSEDRRTIRRWNLRVPDEFEDWFFHPIKNPKYGTLRSH